MAAPVSPEYLALQRAVAGRYSLDRELGRGGMGVVFLARDVALDRPVAIKLLPPVLAADAGARARFLREARTAARLSHPHIVPIHAVEERDGLVWFVMAFVDGETLGERVRRTGPLPVAELLRVTQEVAWALGHAHAHGVVHRDVKPDNVLLERGSGRALVADFGIAQAAAPGHTPVEGTAAGTPSYMSPEQGAGERADARSDLYSLGVTAFYAATGRLPFEAASAAAMLVKHAAEPAPSVLTLRSSLPAAFALAVDRCLAKDPAERWASADALAAALDRASDTGTAVAPPIRAFLRDAASAGSEIGTALTATAASLVVVGTTYLPLGTEIGSFITAVVYSTAATVAAGLGVVRGAQLLTSARAVQARGYTHAAVPAAIVAMEHERAAERELEALDATSGGAGGGRWLVGTVGAVATGAAFWLSNAPVPSGLAMLGFIGSIAAPTATVRALWKRWPRGERLWGRLLAAAPGRLLFRAARVGLVPRATALGEPTVAVLGRAAGQLYAELSADQRARLGDVPALLQLLEADALAARAAGPVASTRLEAAVAALEAVRLDLLRLHAGTGTIDDLTRDLDAARELNARVAAEVEARADVRRLLAPEREATPA